MSLKGRYLALFAPELIRINSVKVAHRMAQASDPLNMWNAQDSDPPSMWNQPHKCAVCGEVMTPIGTMPEAGIERAVTVFRCGPCKLVTSEVEGRGLQ
jgi:hypothetical protein